MSEEVDTTSSGLLLPAHTTSHDVNIRVRPASTTLPDACRRLEAATVAVPPTTSAWCWSAPRTLHTGCSAEPSPQLSSSISISSLSNSSQSWFLLLVVEQLRQVLHRHVLGGSSTAAVAA